MESLSHPSLRVPDGSDGRAVSEDESRVQAMFFLRETGETAGGVELWAPEQDGQTIEFRLVLARYHQESGLAREAASPIFDFIFEVLDKTRVRGWAHARDRRSLRQLEAIGMKRETEFLGHPSANDAWADHVSFVLLRDHWSARHRASDVQKDGGPVAAADFWAITSYFNPAGYRIHRTKYDVFRDHIGVPLVAVELAYGKDFELGPGDATRLVRLRSDQILWQKERLLNLAIEALPKEAEHVAWLDADVVFGREDWVERTREALEHHPIVQPYGRVHDLPPGAGPGPGSVPHALMTRPSLGAVAAERGFDPAATSTNMLEVGSPGHAWAMRRNALEEVGLYDAMIMGSGDNAIAMAALGHIETYVSAYDMNPFEAECYRRWATPFFAVAKGGLGFVPGDLYHLWHGDLSDRGYGDRYPGLSPFEFNPDKDISIDRQGAWKWSSNKPDLHEYVASYFRSRKEDG
jgi:hypothetical protein